MRLRRALGVASLPGWPPAGALLVSLPTPVLCISAQRCFVSSLKIHRLPLRTSSSL
ncbi:hypothetical protein ACWDWU_09520 [Streptomyces sp. NPDC003442]